VIAAGYSNEMRRFIASNPGLASRFAKPSSSRATREKWLDLAVDGETTTRGSARRVGAQPDPMSNRNREATAGQRPARCATSWRGYARPSPCAWPPMRPRHHKIEMPILIAQACLDTYTPPVPPVPPLRCRRRLRQRDRAKPNSVVMEPASVPPSAPAAPPANAPGADLR